MKSIALSILLASAAFPHVVVAQSNDELLGLLRTGNYQSLERSLDEIQQSYESGHIDDVALRNVYRQFYDLDDTALKNLDKWIVASPTSYPARLIRGVYYKRLGAKARGEKYISQTSPERIWVMNFFFQRSQRDLTKSLKLTAKPLLSVFHLLAICGTEGDAQCTSELVAYGDHAMPSNILLRCRYIAFLTPRWGGSYEQMKAFIAQTDKQLADPVMHARLEAIMEDDMGYSAQERGQWPEAIEHYTRALTLADKVGGDFRKDWLLFPSAVIQSWPEARKIPRRTNQKDSAH